MSEIPTEQTQTNLPTPETTTESSISGVENLKNSLGNILGSWKLKAGLGVAVLFGLFLFSFYWQHIIAVAGMKSWASRSGARAIECMVRDTNNDQYVSCSALLDQQIVPLECSSSLLNIGCRVNYGTAAPNLKQLGPRAAAF
ncbi:hypothetical protein IQ270_20415 [Microcoleus sp. LEGE 07076]|uniref:hypothetical protein n=1 Tax=Microcoleus sp. LEGE 07076 TaxID=915322 RepID=UPI0018820161|nr:hypothetical protein [Microcoleus sp. LEGE 07076]MBE9186955.1 hypothetical protein [Microcoleus sp. LEGE 07076]